MAAFFFLRVQLASVDTENYHSIIYHKSEIPAVHLLLYDDKIVWITESCSIFKNTRNGLAHLMD